MNKTEKKESAEPISAETLTDVKAAAGDLAEKYKDILDKVEKMNAIELSELVKEIETRFGVSTAMPVAVAGVAGEEAAAEKDSFNVVLKAAGANKIQVIKVVKEITGVGLQEAKALVDGAPKAIKEGVKREEAEEFKKKLEGAGATVELQ